MEKSSQRPAKPVARLLASLLALLIVRQICSMLLGSVLHDSTLRAFIIELLSVLALFALNHYYLHIKLNFGVGHLGTGLRLLWPILLLGLLSAIVILARGVQPWRLAFGLVTSILIGIFEETAFRGVLFGGMRAAGRPQSLQAQLWISALCFGGMHLLNLLHGANIFATADQVMYAAGMGLLFAATYYRCGSLLPGICVHVIVDLGGAVSTGLVLRANPGVGPFIVYLVFTAVTIGCTYVAIRPSKRRAARLRV